MKLCGKGATLVGAEGRSPPLPFVTVDDRVGANLVRLGLAVRVGDDVKAPAAPVEEPVAPAAPAAEEPKAEAEAPAPEAPKSPAVAEDRAQLIADALDLVEADGLVKTGARAGKPKAAAIAEITGLNDVTVEEIDAAVAAREAA